MANQKISQLTAITSVASGDYFPIVQASGTTNKRVGVDVLDNRYYLTASGAAALSTANQALASGNAALTSAATAQASGNAALSRAGGTMTGPIIFANGQQINTAVNLSGGISGAVAYQSAPSQTAFLNPGVSGQVLTTAGSGSAPTWTTPGGKFLQAVQGTLTSTFSTSSSTYVAIGLSATITPSSASNRIVIIVSIPNFGSASYHTGQSTVYRNGVNLAGGNAYMGMCSNQSYQGQFDQMCYSYIDSPATTSSLTYAVYAANPYGTTLRMNYDSYYGYNGLATIELFEVV